MFSVYMIGRCARRRGARRRRRLAAAAATQSFAACAIHRLMFLSPCIVLFALPRAIKVYIFL
jgi:hypothetical protein